MPHQAKFDRPKISLQDHPKLRNQWPPDAGGAFRPGDAFMLGTDDVLERVFYYAPVGNAKADVSLKTSYQGRHQSRDILLEDAEFAQRLASFLRDKVGQKISEL